MVAAFRSPRPRPVRRWARLGRRRVGRTATRPPIPSPRSVVVRETSPQTSDEEVRDLLDRAPAGGLAARALGGSA